VRLVPGNEVAFDCEEPALLYRSAVRQLPELVVSLYRFEVKADPNQSPIRRGDQLVLTEYPYHNGWEAHATFKAGCKEGKDVRSELITRAIAASEAHTPSPRASGARLGEQKWAHAVVDGLRFDPFENGHLLTAALPPPLTLWSRAPRHLGEKGVFVFGVCADVQACVTALLANEAVRHLLHLAAGERLRVGPPGNQRTISANAKVEAPAVMSLAIRQALAGPVEDSQVTPIQLVERIYKNHLDNVMRRDR
jgi:hypothetical protein